MNTALVWAQFFANLVAMATHPGNADNKTPLEDLATIADNMLIHYIQRFGAKNKWQSSPDSQSQASGQASPGT